MIRFLEANWLLIAFVVVMLTMHRHGGCGTHGHHHGGQHEHEGEQPPRDVEHAHHGGHGREAS